MAGGRKFLYFVRSFRLENSGIYAADIDGSDPVRLVSSLSSGIYAQPTRGRPGYLLWAQNGNLLAQAFDADRTELSGQPVTIVSGVRVLEAQRGLLATVSRTGAIAWATPRATETRFVWYARDGQRIETLALDAGLAMQTRISPDGRRLVFTQVANGMADIFVHDFAERRSRRISQSADYDEQPIWSPDSAEIVHRGNDQGMTTLMRVRIDGAAPAVELLREKGQMTPTTWSPDRRHILFMKFMPGQGMDTLLFPTNDSKTITPLLTGPANDGWALFSPDGRWLAFNSNRSGRNEAYIARFRGDLTPPAISGHPLQISTDGGGVFGWRGDGKEVLLYSPAADRQVMAVPIDARGEAISVGTPTLLFRLPTNHGCCAMTPDADRFLVAEYPYAAGQTIRVLTNWHERIE